VFFDPLQNLYGGGPTEVLRLHPVSLSWNCRNTSRIATFASRHVNTQPKLKLGTPAGVEVAEILCESEASIVEAVRKALHRLIVEDKLPADRIVVLTALGADTSPVWRRRRLGNFTLVEFPNATSPGQVAFATLQRFKGLEADAVILCDVVDGDRTSTPHHLYVGTSRARHVLIVARYRSGARAGGSQPSDPIGAEDPEAPRADQPGSTPLPMRTPGIGRS